MTVLITLSGVGSSAGPTFDLYRSGNGITFQLIVSGINKTALEAGYQVTVADNTTDIKVTSVGQCTNSYVATIGVIPTTTTTTTVVPPTTTTTTTTASLQLCKVNFAALDPAPVTTESGYLMDLNTDRVTNVTAPASTGGGSFDNKFIAFDITPSVSGKQFTVRFYKNGIQYYESPTYTSVSGTNIIIPNALEQTTSRIGTNDYFEIYIATYELFPFGGQLEAEALYSTDSSEISRYFIATAFDDDQCI